MEAIAHCIILVFFLASKPDAPHLSTDEDLVSQCGKVVSIDVLISKLWPWRQIGGSAGGGGSGGCDGGGGGHCCGR